MTSLPYPSMETNLHSHTHGILPPSVPVFTVDPDTRRTTTHAGQA